MNVQVHLVYPFHDVRAGTGVLAAAIALFGPADDVEFLLSAADGLPDKEAVDDFRRLQMELALPYGTPPRMRVVSAEEAEEADVLTRVTATGDPAHDARAILLLAGIGRRFGSAYGSGNVTWLRGDAGLVRVEMDAAFRRRLSHPVTTPGESVRMAVLLQRVQVWGAVDTIVQAGRRHPDVELDVVLVGDSDATYRGHEAEEFAAYLAERGVTLRDEEWLRTHVERLDVVITPDPYTSRWNTSRGLSPRELAEAGIRLVLSPYAQALAGGAENLALLHNLPFHNTAWRIYAPSEGAVANYRGVCVAGDGHVRHLGSAKREHLLTDEVAAREAAALRRRLGTRTVTLWNPHFDSEDGLSTFGTMIEPILGWFGERRQRGLIVRPHPRLFSDYERYGHGDVVATFRRMCAKLPNVHLDESIDAAPALLAADALVSDLSSLIAEYHVLNRPIGLLRPAVELVLNDDRAWAEGTAMIDDKRMLAQFLNRVRPAGGLAGARTEDLGAGERIVESIVADFEQEKYAALARAD